MNTPQKDIERAIRSPTSVYGTPEDVMSDTRIDTPTKRKILRSWEQDARELAVAEAESMTGGEPNMLTRVLAALAEIDDGRLDCEARSPKVPTVHGSAPRGRCD